LWERTSREFVAFQQHPPPAATSTINRRLRLLHRFVEFLTGTPPVIPVWQYRNHAEGFHGRARRGSLRLKEPHRVIQPLRDAEFLTFFGSLRTWRDHAITLLMWCEGLRSMEVLNLTVRDVEFQQKTLRIEGKGNKQRVMPLAEPVANALRLYLRLERPKGSSTSLFLVLKGPNRSRPLTLAGLRRIFRYHRKKSGVDLANPHRFRHSFGANMTRAHVSLLALAKMMGHNSPQTTMRYVEIEDTELRTLYFQALESLLPENLLEE
jgi:site-specific recombinase XerD